MRPSSMPAKTSPARRHSVVTLTNTPGAVIPMVCRPMSDRQRCAQSARRSVVVAALQEVDAVVRDAIDESVLLG